MELKLKNFQMVLHRNCSNRTFMELKYHAFINQSASTLVLIVPLWN